MNAPFLVRVIIVTHNSQRYFPRLKAALEAQQTRFELVVIDNASEQRPHAADFPDGARIVRLEENVGFAAANNLGVSGFDGAFIALLNPDAFPEPDWLEELLAAAKRWPEAAAFGSTQIAAETPDRYDGLGDCYSIAGLPWRGGFGWPISTPSCEGETFSPCAAAALYRTEAWRELGGFDESFFCYCEDVDLGFRLRLAGWACMQAPRAIVHHVGGASSGRRSHFAVFHGTRNRVWTYVQNMPAPLLALTLPAHVLATLCFLAWSPFRGTGKATWRGVGAGLRGLGGAWRRRREVQAARRASTCAIARALSWSPLALLGRAPVLRRARHALHADQLTKNAP